MHQGCASAKSLPRPTWIDGACKMLVLSTWLPLSAGQSTGLLHHHQSPSGVDWTSEGLSTKASHLSFLRSIWFQLSFILILNFQNERSCSLGEPLESLNRLINSTAVANPFLIEVSLCGGQNTRHCLPSYLCRPARIWSVPKGDVCVAATSGPSTRPLPSGDASVPDVSDVNQLQHESATFIVILGQKSRQLLLSI